MENFSYHAPGDVAEAVRLLESAGPGGRVLAGGTDLLVQLKHEPLGIEHVVDIKRIEELDQLGATGDGGFRIGAAVSCARVGEDTALAARWPGVREAAMLIGSDQIQSRATIAGNLCNASPAADTTPALLAAGAECEIAGPGGRRRLPVAAFLTGVGTNALAAGELLVAIHLPAPPPRTADAYQRFIPRNEMDIAVVGVGAQLTLAEDGTCLAARIGLGAVGPTVIDAADSAGRLIGTKLAEADLNAAIEEARAAARPISDKRGPADYRRSLVGTLLRRVVQEAAHRAANAPA